ncbi:outer membrane protein [Bartonella sp. DGB2]|uniref:outer membrane protein n=1 Tax=Bartonella sp. DGB2 TaxID=3388426 RepID=UPI00398FDCBC
MKLKTLLTVSALAIVASQAQAADVPSKALVPSHSVAPAYVVAPKSAAFSFDGFYLGIQGGQGFSALTQTPLFAKDVPDDKGKNKFPADTKKPVQFLGGLFAGYNLSLGDGLVFGVEADASQAFKAETFTAPAGKSLTEYAEAFGEKTVEEAFGLKDKVSVNVDGDYKYSQDIAGAGRVRLGVTFDRVMPYLAGGVAIARVTGEPNLVAKKADKPVGTPLKASNTQNFVGYTLGGGVDFALVDNALLRVEYRYNDFGKKTFDFKGLKDEVSWKGSDIRLGVAYKF